MILRQYQTQAIQRIRQAIMAGCRRILVVAPTGSGKTILGADILRSASAKYRYGLFVAHRREIIHQTSEKLSGFDVDHGILMSGHRRSAMSRVQVCSVQTFHARITNGKHQPPSGDVLIIDEAHRSVSSMYTRLAENYPDAVVLGLTATPVRADGRGLGGFYDHMVEVASVRELMDMGFLVRPKVYAPRLPDLTGVKIRRGDYADDQLSAAMDKTELVGDIVRDWKQYADGRPTVVFATGVRHSMHIAEQFTAAGVCAEHIDGQTPKEQRDEILQRMQKGTVDVVTNCEVLTEGWDMPKVSCAILARPTKSYGLYLQMAGRILRPHPESGKTDAVIIDHAGSVYEHGFVDDAGDWSLSPDERITTRREKRLAKKSAPITCRQCFTVYEGRHTCPSCGWMPTKQSEELSMQEGRLYPVDKTVKPEKYTMDDKQRWYSMLIHVGQERGYKPGWAANQYRQKFSVWPTPTLDAVPQPPNSEVTGWVKHSMIRYAKRRASA